MKLISAPFSELPIKLEPLDTDPFNEDINIEESPLSSSNSSESRSKPKSEHHHHSSRNGHSSKDEKKHKSGESGDKKASDSKHHKSHHSNSSQENSSSKRKHEDTSNESKDASHKKPKLEDGKKDSSSKTDSHTKTSSSSSKRREPSSGSSSKPKEKPQKRKHEKTEVTAEEVDGSQGIGFAEALALFDMPSTSKKPAKDLHLADKMKVTKVTSKASSSSRSDSKKSSSGEDSKKSLKALTSPPKLLTQKPKLQPLPDIVSDLPTDVSIPDYRPMPLTSAVKDYINSSVHGTTSNYMKPQKQMSDKDLLTESFSSKANRMRVYSGNRVQRALPSLFESCIRVLQENIDFLECTGGVPFEILRPVLDRAKPEQLSVIEYYNPYLLEESDVLWEPHCKRKFRNRQRIEMETWRELYERCTREDEIKLNKLTQNIKQHQEITSNGVQKTRLAFLDSMVKPPRGIARKQEIFGTNRKLVVSPAARTVGLKGIMPNLAAAGDARLRVASGLRDDAQVGKLSLNDDKKAIYKLNFHSPVVGRGGMQRNMKKAPMMAKILSKFKR